MNVLKSTAAYESWLSKHATLLPEDLRLKHIRMADGVFPFLRATFYRWAQLFPVVCPKANDATEILAVGDLHVENFGTWRDAEGRLIWGVNDFDEAAYMPYTIDLVRLAVSAQIALKGGHFSLESRDLCDAILTAYEEAIATDGEPFVLGEKHPWLTAAATGELRGPANFWSKLLQNRPASTVPPAALDAIKKSLPDPNLKHRLVQRVAGLGSLGKIRIVALATWHGSTIAREAKALTPSAWPWANPPKEKSKSPILYQQILSQSVRCPDPWVKVVAPWLIRRLAPDCSRIELSDLPRATDVTRLLMVMAKEIANIHLGNKGEIKAIRNDFRSRKPKWLKNAGEAMMQAVHEDWTYWVENFREA